MNRILWLSVVLACTWAASGQVSVEYSDCPKDCKCEVKSLASIMTCKSISAKTQIGDMPITQFELNQPDGELIMAESTFSNMGLKHVNVITVTNSSVITIDKSAFAGLNELTHVKLTHSNVSRIHPDTFKNIPNLIKLNLAGNPLAQNSSLVSETVEELNISHCNLSNIDSAFFQNVSNLVYLDLSTNNIENIKSDLFKNLGDIKEINLSHNEISQIPVNAFSNNQYLDTLDLSNNPLVSFNGSQLITLENLNLRSCLLNQIDADMFKNMHRVSNLALRNNRISSIDVRAFADLNHLAVIDLSTNHIRVLDENVFLNNPSLQKINLDNNGRLSKLPENGFITTSLSFDVYHFSCNYCSLVALPKNTFKSMPALVTLLLSNNKISDVSTGVFQTLTSLIELDLSHNEIHTVNENTFKANTGLKTLSLAHNPLKALHASMFQENGNLNSLDLSHCGLYQLWTSQTTLKLSSLQSLNMSDNKIKIITKDDVAVTTQLKSLDISNNPLDCTNNLKDLIEYLHKHNIKNSEYITHTDNQAYDFEVRQKEDNSWQDMARKRCPNLTPAVEEDEEEETFDYGGELDYDFYQYSDATGITETMANFPNKISDNIDNKQPEGPVLLATKHQQNFRYSSMWPILVFIGTALAVLGIAANIILFVIRRRQAMPVPRIINTAKMSRMKKNSGLVYQQLSEEHGSKTPILSRFVLVPTIYNESNEPEHV